jgi:hypothetical protein
MRGADPLPATRRLIELYITDLAAPQGTPPAHPENGPLSVASVERRLSGLSWGCALRGFTLGRKYPHIATVLAGIRCIHARPPV